MKENIYTGDPINFRVPGKYLMSSISFKKVLSVKCWVLTPSSSEARWTSSKR